MMFNALEQLVGNQVLNPSLSPIEIVVVSIGAALIGTPIFFTMVRAMFFCLIRRQDLDFLWLLSMFQLPDSLCRTRWFVSVYYASLGAVFVGPLGFPAWHVTQMFLRALSNGT